MTGLFLLTLRELVARKVVAGLFGVATLVWLVLALALQLDVVDGTLAGASLFGDSAMPQTEQVQRGPDGDAVRGPDGELVMEPVPATPGVGLLEKLVFGAQAFAAGAAYWVGILLALFATGGLVAALTERGTVDLILAKPLSRSAVLAARLAGVWAVALALCTYLLGAVWFVIALKSGVWSPSLLLGIGVVWGMFVVLYGVVTLVSVWSGSGPLALVVTFGIVFVTLVLAIPELRLQLQPAWRWAVDVPRAVLPRFATVGAGLVPYLASAGTVDTASQPDAAGAVARWLPFLTSVAFGAACYAGAFFLFRRTDY